MANKPFPVAPPGGQLVVCCDYEKLGTKPIKYQGKTSYQPRIAVYFFSEYKDENNRLISIRQEFRDSLRPGRWRTFLENWRGSPFSEDQARAFDPERLIDKVAWATLVHNVTPGRTYANIESIEPVTDGRKLYVPEGFTRKKDRVKREVVAAPDGEDDYPF